MNKKIKLIKTILLGVIKIFVIQIFFLMAYIDDYMPPLPRIEKILISLTGLGISFLLDIIVNYITYRVLRKKDINIKFMSFLIIDLIITGIFFAFCIILMNMN